MPPALRVMIVEDQAILAMELELVLADAGCVVVGCAMDKDGAFAVADREHPDLALVDMNLLDGPTGPGIAEALVAHGTTVIFLTANPEQIPEGFAGAIGAVSKPFDDQTICAAVAFADHFIRHHEMDDTPRRFRLAPWMSAPGNDVEPA